VDIDSLGQIGSALAKARRASRPSDIDLRSIGSLQDAQEVQDAAVMSYGGVLRGYTLAATTARTARLLNCPEPIIGKLFDEHIHDTGATFGIPYCFIGAGAQLIFMLALPLASPVTLDAVSNAVVSCHVGIQLLGRRVPRGALLNEWSATADFGLDVGCVRGPPIENWDGIDWNDVGASLQLNGNLVVSGSAAEVFGNPIAAMLWLTHALDARGSTLQAGDIVATGSCTGLAQVAPGQRVRAAFGHHGHVELDLV